jgi:hypothetical protein
MRGVAGTTRILTIRVHGGRPADYQAARIDSLKKELGDVEAEFDALLAKELPALNKSLAKLLPITPLTTRKAWDAVNSDTDAGAAPKTSRESRFDRD